MKIRWCAEHSCGHLPNAETEGDVCLRAKASGATTSCRFVLANVTPADQVPAPYDIEIPDFVNSEVGSE